jgi:CO/xanthine dehydrogenase FAD-binding subunit
VEGDAPVTATYVKAGSIEDAVRALSEGARAVAGGTDLVVGARQGKSPLPDSLVAIHDVADLRGIEETDAGLVLRALATHEQLVEHPAVRERFTALADASAIVGSHATRYVGTIGGNVMNASPAMETGGPLICFGAVARLVSTGGEREVPLDELFTGPGSTTARPDELLTQVLLPSPAAGTGSCYVRLEYRRQMEIAVVGATCLVRLEDGVVADSRFAITALAPTIRRVPEAERALTGTDGGADAVRRAADAVAEASQPISDVRGSDRYRRAMAAVMARRAASSAIARAGGGDVPIPASPALHGAAD